MPDPAKSLSVAGGSDVLLPLLTLAGDTAEVEWRHLHVSPLLEQLRQTAPVSSHFFFRRRPEDQDCTD